jgi:acyl-CoA synthetase (AMP-forming)/AMP-acid ligase II
VFDLTNDLVESEARIAAGWLRSRGLGRGDRFAIAASNRPQFVPLTMGALRSGVVPVLVNVHLAGAERRRIVDDAQVKLEIDDASWPDWSDAAADDIGPYPLARPMHYTSGTTGLAKGVWSGLFSDERAEAFAKDEAELWGAQGGDTYLVCSPLYHSAPLRIATSALLAGARVMIFERFDPVAVTRSFVEDRVVGAFLVPTHLRRLFENGFIAPAARRILHAGEPCPEALKRRALDVFPPGTLYEFYGSTEGQFTLCAPDEWLERPGTVGRARTGRKLTIRNPGPDGVGTIYVSTPPFARWSYWNDPDKTAQAWSGDSFTVGDLGRLDDDGYLFMEGRREDLIISGGVNVYPAEVERVLVAHPGVTEAAVFGVEDEQWGQRVCAAITGTADAEMVRTYARERLPGSHAPKEILVVETLPRTATGKIVRSELARLMSSGR